MARSCCSRAPVCLPPDPAHAHLSTCQQTARGVRVQAGASLRLPEARALAARAVAATVEYAGAQDAETLTLAMRVGLRAP